MKKIFSFIIISIMFLPMMVFAKEDKIIDVNLNKEFSFSMLSKREQDAFNFFIKSGKISRSFVGYDSIFYLENNKKLCVCDIDNNCVLESNISDKDNFSYLFNELDKNQINNGCTGMPDTRGAGFISDGKCNLLKGYDGIKVTFNNKVENDFVVNVYGGEDVNSMPLVIAQGIFNGFFEDKLNYIMEYNISDLNNKLLSVVKINNFSFNVAPEQPNFDNKYYSNEDIIYTFTEEEIDKYNVPFEKIVLNYSGSSYPDDVFSINMKNDSEVINLFTRSPVLYMLSEANVIKANVKMYFQDKSSKKTYSGVDITNLIGSGSFEDLFNGLIIVDDNTTFTYNIDSNSPLRELLPSGYNRLIVNFIQRRENIDNNSNGNNSIIVNPKTKNGVIVIIGLMSLFIISLFIYREKICK